MAIASLCYELYHLSLWSINILGQKLDGPFFYFPSHFSNVKVKHTFQVDSAGQIKISIQLFRFLSVSKKLNFLFALSNFRMRCHVSEWIVSEYRAGWEARSQKVRCVQR